jgi:hypothetical protein
MSGDKTDDDEEESNRNYNTKHHHSSDWRFLLLHFCLFKDRSFHTLDANICSVYQIPPTNSHRTIMSFSSRRRNYLLTPHRRDGLVEWMKKMLMHSFVLDCLEATGADTFSHFEMLIEEHPPIPFEATCPHSGHFSHSFAATTSIWAVQ